MKDHPFPVHITASSACLLSRHEVSCPYDYMHWLYTVCLIWQCNKIRYGRRRDALHWFDVASFPSKYRTVARYTYKGTVVYANVKNTTLSAPVVTKPINPQQHYMQICYTEFHQNVTVTVEISGRNTDTDDTVYLAPLTLYRRSTDRSIQRPRPYRTVNTFHIGYKNQSVYAVSGTSRCLFSDEYKTQRGQNVQLLNVRLVGASRNQSGLKG